MKAEKGSEIITTICEYENSVAMPDNERLTYLDTCGIARLKDGNGNVKAQEAYANRCSEYLRFGHEVDLAACGGLFAVEDFALLCWNSVNHLPAIRRISLKASLTSRLIDFKYLREAEPAAEVPAGTRWVPSDAADYGFDDDDDDISVFSFPEA